MIFPVYYLVSKILGQKRKSYAVNAELQEPAVKVISPSILASEAQPVTFHSIIRWWRSSWQYTKTKNVASNNVSGQNILLLQQLQLQQRFSLLRLGVKLKMKCLLCVRGSHAALYTAIVKSPPSLLELQRLSSIFKLSLGVSTPHQQSSWFCIPKIL